ncbi:hypothetical protein GCM10027059_28520 [Myceligenerans halotolerans]
MGVRVEVPSELVVVARRQAGLVSVGQCEVNGVGPNVRQRLITAGQWSKAARGVIDTGLTDPDRHPLDTGRRRIVWRGVLAVRNSAAVSVPALALLGARGLPVTFDPEVGLPFGRHRRSREGIIVRQYDFEMSTVIIDGCRVATADWALAQALPRLDRFTAVAVMDSLRYQGILDDVGFERSRKLARGRRGVAGRHGWFGESDPRAESPPESRARLLCADAGIPPDDLQRDLVDDDGEFLGRGDLLWYLGCGRWLVVEIDGAEYHSGEPALRRDTVRQNRMIGSGRTTMLRFYPDELTTGEFTTKIRSVLRSESWSPACPLPPR